MENTPARPQGFTSRPGRARREEAPVKRVLTVDDSAPMRAMLRSMLETDSSVRWEVVQAGSGVEFLDALALQAPFDLCVLDVLMPGMDGYAVCRILRELNQQVPVLFVTAESTPGNYSQGRLAGGDSYLVKPFSAPAFLTAVHMLVNLKRRLPN
jgi:CheY-like chemotaxis protein